jgi:hypothetical protein
VLTAHGAAAQWYVSASAGGVIPMDYTRSVTITSPALGLRGPGTGTTTYNAGEAFNAAIGYSLPMGFRVEGELGLQHFTADLISAASTNGTFPALNGARLTNPSGGEQNLFTATANLFYDLPFSFAGITPYGGGGAGYYEDSSTNAVFLTSQGSTFTARGKETGNAIVLGEVGAAYPLSPSLSLVGSYRYEHMFHSGQNSTPAGANIVKIGQSTRIEVDGYTDTSGTPHYNQALSIRRAQTVGAELVKDGVPKAAISIQGFGETHLLVPTGAGVREPQNRRVEIIIR